MRILTESKQATRVNIRELKTINSKISLLK
jgi:hypothetical protein